MVPHRASTGQEADRLREGRANETGNAERCSPPHGPTPELSTLTLAPRSKPFAKVLDEADDVRTGTGRTGQQAKTPLKSGNNRRSSMASLAAASDGIASVGKAPERCSAVPMPNRRLADLATINACRAKYACLKALLLHELDAEAA